METAGVRSKLLWFALTLTGPTPVGQDLGPDMGHRSLRETCMHRRDPAALKIRGGGPGKHRPHMKPSEHECSRPPTSMSLVLLPPLPFGQCIFSSEPKPLDRTFRALRPLWGLALQGTHWIPWRQGLRHVCKLIPTTLSRHPSFLR